MLKKALLSLCLLSSPAFSDAAPLLIKSQNSGYTPVQYQQSFQCSIYLDHIVIEQSFGTTVRSTENRRINMSGDLVALISGAQSEPFEARPTLCDAPGTRITANSGTEPDMLLFALSSCSKDGTRKGDNSTILLNLVNSLCGAMRSGN